MTKKEILTSAIKAEFLVNALNRIKSIHENYHKLKELGVDLIDYENGVNVLEEAITIIICKDELPFEKVLNDVQWWLYEPVDKIIFYEKDGKSVDVNKAEDFVKWITGFYKK